MKLVRCGIEKFPRFDSRYRLVRNFKILNIATVLVSTDKDVQLYNLVFWYDDVHCSVTKVLIRSLGYRIL